MNKAKNLRKEIKAKDKEWSLKVKTRDNFECIVCGNKERLNAHHIITRVNKTFRWDLDNGLSLCPRHHRFSFDLSAHQNPFVFYIWLAESRKEQIGNLTNKMEAWQSEQV